MDRGLPGKLALVSGGDSGIGWHTAQQLLAEGATVVISDLDQTRLDAAAAELDAPAGRLYAYAADVTDCGAAASTRRSTASWTRSGPIWS